MNNPEDDQLIADWYVSRLYALSYKGVPVRDWPAKDREQAHRDHILIASFLRWLRENQAEVEQARKAV